jgi:SAM-dependent methyltransferase
MMSRAVSASHTKWQAGLGEEIEFWQHWLATRGADWPWDFERRFDPTRELDLDPRFLDLEGKDELHVLDVGSGPLTLLGHRVGDVPVRVFAVDPLADTYNLLLDQAGLEPPVRTRPGEAERLLEVVGDRRFDLVFCRNALDHSHDPVLGIQQMVACAKPGGYVLLRHLIDGGKLEGYSGLHNWNFAQSDDGRFMIWNEQTRVFPVDHLEGAELVVCERDPEEPDRWLNVALQSHT